MPVPSAEIASRMCWPGRTLVQALGEVLKCSAFFSVCGLRVCRSCFRFPMWKGWRGVAGPA
eukprot:547101-Alexandrium_andersonii.AAC.2